MCCLQVFWTYLSSWHGLYMYPKLQPKRWQHMWVDCFLSVGWENGPERGLKTISFDP